MYGWYIGPSHAKLLRSKVDRRRVYGYFTGLSRNTGLPTVHLDMHEDDLPHFQDVFKPFSYTEAVLLLGQDKADSLLELKKIIAPTEDELAQLEKMTSALDAVHDEVDNTLSEAEKTPVETITDDKPVLEAENTESPEIEEKEDSESLTDKNTDEDEKPEKPAARKPRKPRKPKTESE